jgi:hypothetical protein
MACDNLPMRAMLLLVAAMLLGLAGGYAWSTTGSPPAAPKPPKAGVMAIPASPEEQPAELDRLWAERTGPPFAPAGSAVPPPAASAEVYYSGCNKVRAAGKAPLYSTDPGYRIEMDGDNDGIACEPIRH